MWSGTDGYEEFGWANVRLSLRMYKATPGALFKGELILQVKDKRGETSSRLKSGQDKINPPVFVVW